MEKMNQAVMVRVGEIEFHEVEVPKVLIDQVKIKIKKIGVCGSDVHVYHGLHPTTYYPVVQGHEISGEIVELGSNVVDYAVGDKVTVQPQVVCGTCYQCKIGNYHICDELKVMGFQTTGMASDFFVVDATKLMKLPEHLSHDFGALIEPLAVAVHAVNQAGSLDGKNVLVIGGGPIGNLVAQTAKATGAKKVVISEMSKVRVEIAKKSGVGAVNPQDKPLEEAIGDEFGEQRADVIFECVGAEFTIKQAINVARKGSIVVAVGVFSGQVELNMNYIQDHELSLRGTAMYKEKDFEVAIDLVNEGLVTFEPLITNHLPFKDYIEAYHLIDNNKDEVMKIIIDMD